MNKPSQQRIIAATRQWLVSLVIDLNLCPFAKAELINNRIRFAVTDASTEGQLLSDLQAELALLTNDQSIETTLLIHPKVLVDFDDYNQFLDDVDNLLEQSDLEGIYQIATFHPNYQFGSTQPGDAENYTNKSPYPMLHLLREASIERAIASYPYPERIPERNIALMEAMGAKKLQVILQACFDRIEQ